MPTNDNNNNNVTIEVMDEQELFEKYGYEAPDEEPVDPNELLAEPEYPECDVIFAEGPLPAAFQGAVVAPEAVEEKTAEQAAENNEDLEAEAADKAAQAVVIAEILARTEGAPRLSDTTEAFLATPPVEWTVKGYVQVGGITVINGASFDGKSLLTMDMMASVISGQPWCNQETKKASVFYYDFDDAKIINVERFEAILRGHGLSEDVLKRWHYISAEKLGAITPYNPLLSELLAREVLTSPEIDETSRAVIVIDTLLAFCGSADANEATAMGPAFKSLRRALVYLAKCGIKASVVVLHHYRKDTPQEMKISAKTYEKKISAVVSYGTNKSYGSNAIINNAEIVAHVISDPADQSHKALAQTKNRKIFQKLQKYLDMYFDSVFQGDMLEEFKISAMERPLYTAAQEKDDSDTPRYNARPQKAAAPRVNYEEKVLQYVSENPGVGRYEMHKAAKDGILGVGSNYVKDVIDKLITAGKLYEGAPTGTARKGGLYIA